MAPRTLLLAIGTSMCLSAAAQTIERVRLSDNDLSCIQVHAEIGQMDTVIALAGTSPAAPPATLAAPVAVAPAPAAALPAANPLASGFAAALGGALAQAPGVAGLMPAANGVPVGVYADPGVQAALARARAAGHSDAQINAMMQLGAARAGYPVRATGGGQLQMAAAQGALAQGAAVHQQVLAGQAAARAPATAPAAIAAAPVAVAAVPSVAPPATLAPAGSPLAAQARARKEHLTGLFLARGCKLSEMPK